MYVAGKNVNRDVWIEADIPVLKKGMPLEVFAQIIEPIEIRIR